MRIKIQGDDVIYNGDALTPREYWVAIRMLGDAKTITVKRIPGGHEFIINESKARKTYLGRIYRKYNVDPF